MVAGGAPCVGRKFVIEIIPRCEMLSKKKRLNFWALMRYQLLAFSLFFLGFQGIAQNFEGQAAQDLSTPIMPPNLGKCIAIYNKHPDKNLAFCVLEGAYVGLLTPRAAMAALAEDLFKAAEYSLEAAVVFCPLGIGVKVFGVFLSALSFIPAGAIGAIAAPSMEIYSRIAKNSDNAVFDNIFALHLFDWINYVKKSQKHAIEQRASFQALDDVLTEPEIMALEEKLFKYLPTEGFLDLSKKDIKQYICEALSLYRNQGQGDHILYFFLGKEISKKPG